MGKFAERPAKRAAHAGRGDIDSFLKDEVRVEKYSDDEERDDHGRWTGSGGGGVYNPKNLAGDPLHGNQPETALGRPGRGIGGALRDAHQQAVATGDRLLQTPSGHRALHEIASDISHAWGKQPGGVNYAAEPYLSAMHGLSDIKDNYGADSAKSVVSYFLANASGFKGEAARGLKAELKATLTKSVSGLDSFLKDEPSPLADTPGRWTSSGGGSYHTHSPEVQGVAGRLGVEGSAVVTQHLRMSHGVVHKSVGQTVPDAERQHGTIHAFGWHASGAR